MIPQGLMSIDKISGIKTNSPSGQKVAASPKDLFTSILNTIMNQSRLMANSGENILSQRDVLKGDKNSLLDLVKKFVLSKWGSLDNLVLDENGLADLEKFLIVED